ncbi:MAG: hypothetical protein GXO23_06370 [Crenarchaeota archaeon]|nr:hypothetical protein [Thermoproteota archaeon]
MHSRIPISVIVTRYSWIVPIIVEIRNELFDRNRLEKLFGISSRLARSIIWVMTRLALIERTDDKYRIASERLVEEVSRRVLCKRDRKYYVLREGESLIIVNIRRERVSVRRVDRTVVRRIYEALEQRSLSIRELSELLSEKVERVSTALKILNICGVVDRGIDEIGRTFYSLRSATDPSLISRLIFR